MFKEGTIIYFPNYLFRNGDSKAKFFIVIKEIDENLMIANLPTSVDHIPAFAEIEHGCVNLEEANFNCYVFNKKKVVTECGWFFSKPTYIYGSDLFFKKAEEILKFYPIEDVNYSIKGRLTNYEYFNLCECLRNSGSVARKYKNKL